MRPVNSALGAIVGLVLSIPVTVLLGSAIETSPISAEFPIRLSWARVALWVGIALTIGGLGALQPARTAARLTIRDTLAYE